ncbi:MAG: PhoH family protein [Pseudomonadota bacterium]
MTSDASADVAALNLENGPTRIDLAFADNQLLVPLFGEYHQNLAQIEHRLGVRINTRGNHVVIEGPSANAAAARRVLEELYARLENGLEVEPGDVDGAIRMAERSQIETTSAATARHSGLAPAPGERARLAVRRRVITARSVMQATYMARLADTPMVFALGPAGTGKTYLAVAQGVAALLEGRAERIILSRPAVEAGENLGFLPGDMREKVDPYLRPLYDALYDLMPPDQVERRFRSGEIEIAPLAFMRGRTLSNAFVILDEAQNTSRMQMKMFLTRFGHNARMVIAGDPSQVDLPPRTRSGLHDAVAILGHIPGIAVIRFTAEDVVRHALVGRIVDAYDEAAAREADKPAAPPC